MPAWRIHQFGLLVRDAATTITRAVEGKPWVPNELTTEGGAGRE